MMPWLHDLTQESSSNSLLLSWSSLGSQLLGCFFSYKEPCIVAYISIVARTWSLSSWWQGHLCACPAACSVAPSMLPCPSVMDRTAQALSPWSYLTSVCTELSGAAHLCTNPVPRSYYLSPWSSLAMLISNQTGNISGAVSPGSAVLMLIRQSHLAFIPGLHVIPDGYWPLNLPG